MYYVLYTIHYLLYTIYYVLCTIYYVLCTRYYILYTILYTMYYVLYTIYAIQLEVLYSDYRQTFSMCRCSLSSSMIRRPFTNTGFASGDIWGEPNELRVKLILRGYSKQLYCLLKLTKTRYTKRYIYLYINQ